MRMNWGMIIGLIGGGIGILVGLIAVIGTKQWFPLVIMVVVIGIMGTVFWRVLFRPMMINSRLSKTGISTTAKIVEVSDTGVTVNNAPQVKLLLEVYPPNGQAYLVETKQLISRLQTSMFQPGGVIPVLIDPDDKDLISLVYEGNERSGSQSFNQNQNMNPGSVVVGPWAGLSSIEAEKKLRDIDAKNKEIFNYGTSSKAIVTKYTWLGIYVGGQNEAAELELQVTPSDRPAFSATVVGVFMAQSVPKFQPGEEIFVKFDPSNTSKVTVEHS